MRKVSVSFEGADGSIINQDHYFHMTETDFADAIAQDPELFKPSRLKELVTKSEAATGEDKVTVQAEMASFVKAVIVKAHGARIDNQFFHDPDETRKFTRGLACNAVIQKVLENEQTLLEFFGSVLPVSMREGFAKAAKE